MMECKICDGLLAEYEQRVRLFTNAERRFQETKRDDFPLALTVLKRLKQACGEADDALLKHCRQEHGRT